VVFILLLSLNKSSDQSSRHILYINTLRITQYEQHFLGYITKESVHYTSYCIRFVPFLIIGRCRNESNLCFWLLCHISQCFWKVATDLLFCIVTRFYREKSRKVVQGLLSKLLIGWRQIWMHVKKDFNWTKFNWYCD